MGLRLYEIPRNGRFTEIESRVATARGQGWGTGTAVEWVRGFLGGGENVLELDGGGCAVLCMY